MGPDDEVRIVSPVPAYRQLADILRAQIERGDYDVKIPSEPTLTQRYGVARGTVRKAIAVLQDEGLVITVPGRGTFLATAMDT